MVRKRSTGRFASSGGASSNAAAPGYAPMEFTHKGIKTEERAGSPGGNNVAPDAAASRNYSPVSIFPTEALPPYKCSALSTGYLFPQSFISRLPVVFLFAVLFSACFVSSDALDPNSEEGNCNFNMIGISALSCQHFNGSSNLPSSSCCTSLLYAIDELPPVGESGECCLCRYTINRGLTPKLATSYIACNGKARDNVTTWTYPIRTCRPACKGKNVFAGKNTPAQIDHSGGHGSMIIIVLAVASLCLILLVGSACFCWSRQTRRRRESLPMRNLEMQQGEMPDESGSQSENSRSSGQLKGRRNSSGRRRSLHGSPNVQGFVG